MNFFRLHRTLLLAYGVFYYIGHMDRNTENWKIEKIKLDLETNAASRLYIYMTMYNILRESIRNCVSNDNLKID